LCHFIAPVPRRRGRPPIDLDRFHHAKSLFLDALDLPADQRVAFATERAGSDRGALAEVLELLRLHEVRAAGLGSAEPAPLPPAIGPYRVLGRLGEGGMGVVYRARRGDEPPVAIKVLAAGIVGDRLAARLAREAAALERLDHPGIARHLGSGLHVTTFGSQPFVVMELVEGEPLHLWARRPEVDDRARLALIGDLCDAVAHAHERGVVHRDLKPANIVVDASGRPHVLDFGIARIADIDGTLLTRSGELLGTIRYMSPEQAQGVGEATDPRSDIYALGVIAYELLADRPPYELPTRSVTRALVTVATVEPTPLGRHCPALKGDVESILDKALQKRPEDRYASAAAMGADIRRHLDQRPVTAAAGRLWRRVRALARRRRLALPLSLVALVAAAVATATVPWLRHRMPLLAAADLRAMDDRVAAADAPLHADDVSLPVLDSLAGVYERADGMLASYPMSDGVLDLRRHVHWRLGEACYLAGVRRRDPDALRRALDCFALANLPPRPHHYASPLPKTFRLSSAINGMTPEQSASGMSMVEAELATYREPLFHMRRASDLRAGVLASLAESDGQGSRLDPLVVRPVPPVESFGLALNEYGEALSWVGMLADSVAPIDRALACFARADSLNRNGGERIAYASILFNRGTAHLRRAEITGAAADLDSAESFLGAALTLREEVRRPSRADAHLMLSRVMRARARREAGAARHRSLQAAEDQAEAALAVLRSDRLSPAAFVPALVEAAGCDLDRFDLVGGRGALDRAARHLGVARPGLDPARAPYPAAWYALLQARLLRAHWSLERTEAVHAAAVATLERARGAMPRDQDAVFNRRVVDEARRLGIETPR
jgi:serine/threonine protein kinase